jgi:uncharacterized RDD family membrane protein YckC
MVTPEGVPLELETAGLGSRFVAILVDWAVQGVALVAGGMALALSGDLLGSGAAGLLMAAVAFGVIWGYPVAMETLWRGRSLGKAAVGLRVVTKEGGQVTFRHAAIRAALGLVDFLLTSGGAAVVSVLLTADNQRLGDLAAGTVVLRERSGYHSPTPVVFQAPPGLERYAASLDCARLGASDYQAIRSFLVRAPGLSPGARAGLAAQLAGAAAARVEPPPPPGTSSEAFLACVAVGYQRRHAPASTHPPPA